MHGERGQKKGKEGRKKGKNEGRKKIGMKNSQRQSENKPTKSGK